MKALVVGILMTTQVFSFEKGNFDGDYQVRVQISAKQRPLIGTLTLKNGKYIFHAKPPSPRILTSNRYRSAKKRLVFLHKTSGSYEIKLSRDRAGQAEISFLGAEKTKQRFLILHNVKNKTLDFHSPYSEIQLWQVHKPIN